MKVFGTRLHTARVISGLSLQGLSDAIGNIVSKQSMSMYESGLMEPRRRTLNAIADALGVSVNYFYKGVSSKVDFHQSGIEKGTRERVRSKVAKFGYHYKFLSSF